MKYSVFIAVLIAQAVCAQTTNTEIHPLFDELERLANSEGYEFIYGDKFPIVNPYGSYGATYVYNLVNFDNSTNESVLFLCRKLRDNSMNDEIDVDWRDYEYALLFANRKEEDSHLKIHSIVKDGIGLMGLSLFYADLEMTLDEFRMVEDPSILGPSDVPLRMYPGTTIPVIISAETSTTILYLYKDKWYKHVWVMN